MSNWLISKQLVVKRVNMLKWTDLCFPCQHPMRNALTGKSTWANANVTGKPVMLACKCVARANTFVEIGGCTKTDNI